MTATTHQPHATPPAPETGEPRPRHRLAWTVVAIIGALFIVVPLTLTLLADTFSRDVGYTSPDNGRPHPVRTIDVDAGAAQLTVTTGPPGRVTLTGDLRYLLKRPRIERTWDGDTLKVGARCEGFVDQYVQDCAIDLHLTVPQDVALTVRGGSGDIKVRDLTGRVDLAGGSGAMKLRALKGTVHATVDSGEIQATQLTSPDVDLSAGSGTLHADFTTPPQRVVASTGSGAVTLTVPAATRYQVRGDSGSGSRTIAHDLLDATSPHVLDISSGSGSVTIGYPTDW
ncbi:DUF4097 family beta strand repeat-containing protein [Streptomyces sp. Edi4]|uniref:DUF4097 family beta strand repeat-containing protein n=1 Tax=Streptomyces sp. Edi4 TaxID=3162527 RepID=UPI00330591B5